MTEVGFMVIFRNLQYDYKELQEDGESKENGILAAGDGLLEVFYFTIIETLYNVTTADGGRVFRYYACLEEKKDSLYSKKGIFGQLLTFGERAAQVINREFARNKTRYEQSSYKELPIAPRAALGLIAKDEEIKFLRWFILSSLGQKRDKKKNTIASDDKTKTGCQICGIFVGEMFSCSCGGTSYCSKECQGRHWASHSKICALIN